MPGMTWSAFTCMTRGKACCRRRACSRSKTPRPASCSKWTPAEPEFERSSRKRMRSGSPNWIVPCVAPAWAPPALAPPSRSPRPCKASLRNAAEGGEDEGRNPKSEGRNPKEIRRPKSEEGSALRLRLRHPADYAAAVLVFFFHSSAFGFRISDFGLLSDFGLRISDFVLDYD